MTQDAPITRLLTEESGSPETLRAILHSASGHDPTASQLRELTERLTAVLPPGTIPQDVASPPEAVPFEPSLGTFAAPMKAKLAMGVVGLCVATGGVWYGVTTSNTPAGAPPDSSHPTATAVVPIEVDAGVRPEASLESSRSGMEKPRAPRLTSSAEQMEANLETEAQMLSRAHQQLLHGSPAEALATVRATERAHPRGILSQERDRIRIEALLKLGRRSEAERLAEAFRKAYPKSSHNARLDALLGVSPKSSASAEPRP